MQTCKKCKYARRSNKGLPYIACMYWTDSTEEVPLGSFEYGLGYDEIPPDHLGKVEDEPTSGWVLNSVNNPCKRFKSREGGDNGSQR